jgi:hypothetical protein
MSSPTTSTVAPAPVSGSAISSAVRNWLEASPRTATRPPARIAAGRISRGGKPSLPR